MNNAIRRIMSRIKILHVVMFIAAMSFSVRFVDLAKGVYTLSNAAQAEAEVMEVAQAEAAAPSQAGLTDPQAVEMPQEAAPPAEEAAQNPEAPPAVIDQSPEGEDWQDANDSDLTYSGIKMELFEDLSARRKELEQKEQQLATREALIKAAERELDQKYQELSALREQIEKLLVEQSEEEQASIQSLVKIYEGMKPKEAARIFDTLDLDVLVSVLSRMSERRLSPILAAMNPERARTVTILLAEQKQLPSLPDSQ